MRGFSNWPDSKFLFLHFVSFFVTNEIFFRRRVVYRLRQNIFDAIIQQEIGFFDDTRTGELTNRLSSDTQVLQNAVTVNISMLFRFLIQILGSLVVMFYLEVTLTLVLMVVVPIIVLIAKQYGGVVQKLRKRFQDELAGAGTTAEESISNISSFISFVCFLIFFGFFFV